jgi:excisionase family DNA binding protein
MPHLAVDLNTRGGQREALVTEREEAARLGVHVQTLRKWRREGRVPFIRLPGGDVRYEPSTLDAFLARLRQPARSA